MLAQDACEMGSIDNPQLTARSWGSGSNDWSSMLGSQAEDTHVPHAQRDAKAHVLLCPSGWEKKLFTQAGPRQPQQSFLQPRESWELLNLWWAPKGYNKTTQVTSSWAREGRAAICMHQWLHYIKAKMKMTPRTRHCPPPLMTWIHLSPLRNWAQVQKMQGRSELTDNYNSTVRQNRSLRENYCLKIIWIQVN